jgi:hypothetical protein
MQRHLLRVLIFHIGLHWAVPVRSLMITLRNAMKRNPTEREIKDAVRSLVVDFKLRIGASRSDPPGYYLISNADEAKAAAQPYISEIRNLVRRVRVLLDPHQLAELAGQLSFEHDQLLNEQSKQEIHTEEGK